MIRWLLDFPNRGLLTVILCFHAKFEDLYVALLSIQHLEVLLYPLGPLLCPLLLAHSWKFQQYSTRVHMCILLVKPPDYSWSYWSIILEIMRNGHIPNPTIYDTQKYTNVCNFPECHGGADPACQGGCPSTKPSRVLLAPSGARHRAAGEGHGEEHGWFCYYCPPCAQGDTLEGPSKMWGLWLRVFQLQTFNLPVEDTCYIFLPHPLAAEVTTVASLSSKNSREQWENIFNQNYIEPILQVSKNLVLISGHLLSWEGGRRTRVATLSYIDNSFCLFACLCFFSRLTTPQVERNWWLECKLTKPPFPVHIQINKLTHYKLRTSRIWLVRPWSVVRQCVCTLLVGPGVMPSRNLRYLYQNNESQNVTKSTGMSSIKFASICSDSPRHLLVRLWVHIWYIVVS